MPQAAAALGGGTPVAPVLGRAASGGAVIVVLKDQHANLNLRTQAAQRTAAAHAGQRSIVSGITASGGTDVTQLVAPNAVAAHVSAAEVGRLRRDSAVAEIVPDVPVQMQPPGSAPTPLTSAVAAPRRSTAAKATTCPFNRAGSSRPLQEPEAVADVHASNGNPNAHGMANSIATGTGVIIANDGMNQLAGNPNFTRSNGAHVVIDAPSYKANDGNSESYGDASSMAAQGTVTYQYSKALPYSPVPAGCSFYIKGDAPGASLVDLTEIDTPILALSKVIAGIDRVVAKVHADVISESFGVNSVPPNSFANLLAQADEAAVQAGVTVVESSGDSGASGTVMAASDDPAVIAAGAVDNFRLVAMNDGYHSYASNQMAALSSGGTTPTDKLVNLVAPGWYGGEAACADNSGGCPPNYPTEAMRGTSEAAPLIAGAAADVIQAYRDTHRGTSPTPEVVQGILTSTATDLGNPADQQGAGLLNVYAAVRAAQQMPGSTDTTSPAGSPSLVVSPWQLDLAGNGGSASDQSVDVYNTSRAPTTVAGTYRWIGPEHQIGSVVTERITAPGPSAPIPPQGATAAKSISFKVSPGLDLLDADMIWPDPANSNILQFQLFNPQGALVQESYDDPFGDHNYGRINDGGVPNIQHATVSDPEPGTWTARILWSGLDVDPAQGPEKPGTYRGPMQFKVSGQDYLTAPASPSVTIPGHSSVTIPLSITMPRQPGDYPESVQFSAGNGARTSLPVARRVFIPSRGGPFQTLITSTVGRAVGQINTYEINVPAGRRYLDVKLHTADASHDNKFTFYLVNPSGKVVATGTTPKTVSGKSVTTASLYTLHPTPGPWRIDVVLDLTVSGKEFTQTVYGTLTDP
ncbi:MAG: S8 family serine peptidase [Streptosporangiaceae bacterium]